MSSESYGGSECSVECIVLTVRKVGNSYLENWLIERVNTRGVNERMQDTPQSQSSTGIEGCASKLADREHRSSATWVGFS